VARVQRDVWRIAGRERRRARDDVAVEEALEVQVHGSPLLVTMRTPGQDFELVAGLLLSEGVATVPSDITAMRAGRATGTGAGDGFNVVDVGLAPAALARARALGARRVTTTSACGACGTTSLARLAHHAAAATDDGGLRVPASVLAALPGILRAAQPGFARTGGSHAAGLFDATSTLVCAREDVGRHNAFDKVLGWALLAGRLPLRSHVLLASGRASYELVHKAAAAGVALVAAVSAPSSAAVDLATELGLTLVGFLRGEAMNVYAGPARVT